MKQLVLLSAFLAVSAAMPRYLVIPLEDAEFVGGAPSELPVFRYRRQVEQEEEPNYVPLRRVPSQGIQADRRQLVGPGPGPAPVEPIPGSFINALQGANIPTAGDNLAAGSSSYHSPPQGADYVDYGGYDGKHGSFGWYTDHPVLIYGHH